MDISEYHSQADRIAELEAEVLKLQTSIKNTVLKVEADHKRKTNKLKVTIRGLQANRSMWRGRCRKLNEDKYPKKESRTGKARVFVQAWIDGDKSLTFREIGDLFFLSRETIKTISYDLQHPK